MTWPWLGQLPVNADSSEPFVTRNAIRNDDYLARFFGAVRQNKKILFFGTSESINPYNLGAQLNFLSQDGLQLVVFAHSGISPIHSALAIARALREGIRIPPLILTINPVYFTQAYDLIDDGWMTHTSRSPIFIEMNHRDLNNYLSEDGRAAYEAHFALRRLLYPATAQEYLGNLLYLRFHQRGAGSNEKIPLPTPKYAFDRLLPNYDEERNVWANTAAIDRFAKRRWSVSTADESINLKGLASIVAGIRNDSNPVLLLLLPVNRKFYEYHGLDMAELNGRYRAIRRRLHELSQHSNVYFLDLYDTPQVQFGFRDRMHMDQYGFFQLASFLKTHETYLRFLDAAKEYYNAFPPEAVVSRATMREP
jgi:hypothetical protein